MDTKAKSQFRLLFPCYFSFFVNGAKRIIRGEQGESAAVYMNDRPTNLNAALEPNCEITA